MVTINEYNGMHLLIQLGTHAFKPLKYRVNVYHVK